MESSTITNKEIQTYLSDIKQQLSLTHSSQEITSIMQMLESSIDDFISEYPSASINDLKEHFGDVNEVKELFFSYAEPEDLEDHLSISKKSKKYIKTFLFCIVLILLTYIGFKIKFYMNLEKTLPSYEIIEVN